MRVDGSHFPSFFQVEMPAAVHEPVHQSCTAMSGASSKGITKQKIKLKFGILQNRSEPPLFPNLFIREKGNDFVLLEDLFSLGQLAFTRFLVDIQGVKIT